MNFDLESTTGLYHAIAHLGPELCLVQDPATTRNSRAIGSRVSGKLSSVAPLLDSLISLLPYDPQNKPQYAMTLALSKKSANLYVSADNDSRLNLAPQGMAAIKKCWSLIQDAINDVEFSPTGLEQITESALVRGFIVYHLSSGRQHARFRKRSRECAAWFALLKASNLLGLRWEEARSYFNISERVYELYEDAIAKGCWTDQDIVKLCEHADAIKWLEKRSRKDLQPTVSRVSTWFRHINLEAVLPLPLNDLPRYWDFDASRYIDKLIRPAVHAIELFRLSKCPKFRRMFKGRPLHVTEVHAAEYGTQYVSPILSTTTVHRFICGLRGQAEDKDILIADVNSALPNASCNVTFRTHPVCHLIRYHDERNPHLERPFPYITTYRLSGYLCQRFVQLHKHFSRRNEDCTSWVGFVLNGWKTRVEMDWSFPVTSSEHIYSRLIGVLMHEDLVDILESRMDRTAKRRARREGIPLGCAPV
ncbi:hypothetical protein VNI00_002041 [Paramarasmius palmivorus]|uniref:Uncharacterized protein n=1 Tax=Paramarasmius palmivorus TaxID=297713 RepID=A0AAW0E6X9_9AGAR